jgi:hypothetical protein
MPTIGSNVPWQRRNGVFAFAVERSASRLAARGSHVESATTHARRSGWRSARCDRDAFGRDAAVDLARDERGDAARRILDPCLVLRVGRRQSVDVVPRAHRHVAVDRDGSHGRVREDEAHGEVLEPELGHDGLEVVAVGAETVQPDDGGARFGARCDLDAGEQGRRHGSRRTSTTESSASAA